MCSDFARTLALLRKERGVSQRTAARDLGVSQALLSHYENGIREPGLAFVARVCDYYHVSADYMLGRTLSKDGAIILPDEVYDSSLEKGNVLRGSVMATLQKKLIVNTASVLFDLLGKLGDKEAINTASAYLSAAMYRIYRLLYRMGGNREDYFSMDAEVFFADGAALAMKRSELDYIRALKRAREEKIEFPAMDAQSISAAYPGLSQSVTQVLHNTDARVEALLQK